MINTNKTSKTGRKNKTNMTMTWPAKDFFSHQDLKNSNADFIDITLRVRVKAEVESGKLKDIGVIHNGKGRPKNVYALTVTKNTIEKAKEAGVILHSQYLVEKIADITNTTTHSTNSTNVERTVIEKTAVAV